MNNIKHVFIHYGNIPEYLKIAMERSRKSGNEVVLIEEIKDKKISMLDEFKKQFINMSTNSSDFELMCFLRWFVLLDYMKENNLDTCFYTDSDVLVYANINEKFKDKKQTYYSKLLGEEKNYGWCMSAHTSFWTIDTLEKFCLFCLDMYKNNISKLEEKYNYHKQNNIAGGICDMTLFYLFSLEHEIGNICDSDIFGGNFDHCVNISYGSYYGEYKCNGIKIIQNIDGKLYFVKNKNDEKVLINSIHFQGGAKHLMSRFI